MLRNKNIKKYRHAGMHAGSNFQWRVPFLGFLYNSRPSAAVYATTGSDVEAAGCLTDTKSSGTGGGSTSTPTATTPSVFMKISAEARSSVYVQEQEAEEEDKKQESPTAGVAGDVELGYIPRSAPHQTIPQNVGGVHRT
jgi:hypothetical protein